MIEAVIFDMDGLIIETEHLHSQSYEYVLRNHGVEPEFNVDGIIHKVGVTAKDCMTLLKKKHNLKEDVDSLIQEKQKFYIKLLKENLEPKEGLLSLIETLKKKKLKIAVASSSSTEQIRIVLKGLHLIKYFDAIVSGVNVKKGKPHPDIFLEAAGKLKVKPEACIVLEDAQSGVIAGKAAGMKVIAIPNQYTRSHDFSKADKVVNSLKSVTIDMLNSF